MMNLYKWIASCFGTGYLKGGGTVAALLTCIVWWVVQADGNFQILMVPATAVIIILGIWIGNRVEKDWGKDSSRVVIDEVAGMCISLLFIPVSIQWVLIGLALFRFFDIVKPLYIRKAEALPAGWGVMADDVLAGIYSNLVLQVIIYLA